MEIVSIGETCEMLVSYRLASFFLLLLLST